MLRIFVIRVPAIIPGRISPGMPSRITMCVRLPPASSKPPVVASAPTSTPAPESPSNDGPYQAKALPLRAVQMGATPERGVPPVPMAMAFPTQFTSAGSVLVYTPVGPPHTGYVGDIH